MHAESRTGFLVVLRSSPYIAPQNPSYEGLGRVPAYPSAEPMELSAMDAYVFGDYKSLETDLIPTYKSAVELWKLFRDSPRDFDILLWCSSINEPMVDELKTQVTYVVPLGYDVATLGGCWSIAQDIPTAQWADAYREKLNKHGLFPDVETADRYLAEYGTEQAADYDMDFQIGFIFAVGPPQEIQRIRENG